jgi:hypothetical protein
MAVLIENMASSVMTIIMLIVTMAIINSDYVDGDYGHDCLDRGQWRNHPVVAVLVLSVTVVMGARVTL